jgi:hypothetical protein
VAGAACLVAGTIAFVSARNLFNARVFGARIGRSLSDPGMAAYTADRISGAIVKQRPDLIAVRPLLVAGATSMVTTRPFVALAEYAARRAHQAALSEASRRLALSVPDFRILLEDALYQASPEIAARIPKQVSSFADSLGDARLAESLIRVGRLGGRLGWLWKALWPLGVLILVLAAWLAQDRRLGLVRIGGALVAIGLCLTSLVPAASIVMGWVRDPLERGAARALLYAFFGDLGRWGLFYAGLGILFAAGTASLLERVDPIGEVRRYSSYLIAPPASRSWRFVWAVALLLAGALSIRYPAKAVKAITILIATCAAYLGARELFRLFLERLAPLQTNGTGRERRHTPAVLATAGVLIGLLCAAWLLWRNPGRQLAEPEPLACNGYPQLCDKRLDEVVLAGTHNSMSNQEMPGWMFPQQEASIPHQLRDGIHALLIDVHYGFAGGVRIKTDTSTEPMMDKVKAALGDEGFAAAVRIRNHLVGVDEKHRQLYLCHGLCELGAYELEPALRGVRDFLVGHPDEVLIVIIEDYVDPSEEAAAFERAGLADFVFKGASGPPWPTLRELIESEQRVVTFLESGRPGVPWLRPAFVNLRETPYSFHKPEQFSCRANRGDDAGSLFLINNWIDTTPAPKPSNAVIVNADDFLYTRAEKCARERNHIPNIIAVDFYRTGDLLKVVDRLNGVGGQ